MAEIFKAITANAIKNGTILIAPPKAGWVDPQTIDTYVKNTPTIAQIETKYVNRFDDAGYYV